jgi:hypothetical protein
VVSGAGFNGVGSAKGWFKMPHQVDIDRDGLQGLGDRLTRSNGAALDAAERAAFAADAEAYRAQGARIRAGIAFDALVAARGSDFFSNEFDEAIMADDAAWAAAGTARAAVEMAEQAYQEAREAAVQPVTLPNPFPRTRAEYEAWVARTCAALDLADAHLSFVWECARDRCSELLVTRRQRIDAKFAHFDAWGDALAATYSFETAEARLKEKQRLGRLSPAARKQQQRRARAAAFADGAW